MDKKRYEMAEKMAYEIREFLIEHQMWVDVTIYFNGKAISTDDRHGHYGYNDKSKLFLFEGLNPQDYFEYGSGGVICMSFEGDFYDVVNYGADPEVYDAFDKLLEKYGCYYELGNPWNLGVYPV